MFLLFLTTIIIIIIIIKDTRFGIRKCDDGYPYTGEGGRCILILIMALIY